MRQQLQLAAATAAAVLLVGVLVARRRRRRDKGKGPKGGVSWLRFTPDDYDAQLAAKVQLTRRDFAPFVTDSTHFEVNPSEPTHFRSRARFAIARFPPPDGPMRFALFEGGKPSVAVDSFPIASLHINALMPRLLAAINGCEALGGGGQLAAVHFLGSSTGDMLISLIYAGAPLPAGWHAAADALRIDLSSAHGGDGRPAAATARAVSIVGRCKGTIAVLGRDYVEEVIGLADGRRLTYKQVEGSFSNPSAAMAGRTLDFLSACAADAATDVAARAAADGGGTRDVTRPNLLELYCGNGNHTVALARHFALVLAVEIDRKLCDAAEHNLAANSVSNASVLCVSSGRFCGRLLRHVRKGRAAAASAAAASAAADVEHVSVAAQAADGGGAAAGAAESAEAQWMREAQRRTDVVLVDPPRCGLDDETRGLVQLYDHILYISCNPSALLADLHVLSDAYTVERMAIFDHFAYSHHLEVGVHLRRRNR